MIVVSMRFERMTVALEVRCSIQLSYETNLVPGVGLEPTRRSTGS